MTHAEAKQGRILQILRMSTEDGPGIRTSVFFKGCPLGCLWCHNPESISPKPQIQWLKTSCIGCGLCVETCPEKALEKTPDGIVINRLVCTGCGLCTEECPTTAMELLGRKWSVPDLVRELIKDRVYFDESGGGVTLSGGEAALQHEFCLPLLKELRAKGISTALDTCGQAPQKTLAALLPYVDVLLYDLKEIDPEKHKRFTGADNAKILENAVFAARFKKTHPYPKTLWIRTPVIPDATDTPKTSRASAGSSASIWRERLTAGSCALSTIYAGTSTNGWGSTGHLPAHNPWKSRSWRAWQKSRKARRRRRTSAGAERHDWRKARSPKSRRRN